MSRWGIEWILVGVCFGRLYVGLYWTCIKFVPFLVDVSLQAQYTRCYKKYEFATFHVNRKDCTAWK